MEKFICVFIGGGVGSVLRYAATQLAYKYFKYNFIGTIAANLFGCFIMGLVMGVFINKANIIPQNLKLLISVGFLGGLTTFSTFSFETLTFLKDGKFIQGISYMILSCLFGLVFAYTGFYLSTK